MNETERNEGKQSTPATVEKERIEESTLKIEKKSMQKHGEKLQKSSMDDACEDSSGQGTGVLLDVGKRRFQICFRITEGAMRKLEQVAELFGMSESDFSKATLYMTLGIFEPIDRRRRRRKHPERRDQP